MNHETLAGVFRLGQLSTWCLLLGARKKQLLECSETKEYATIFCEVFAKVSVTNFPIFS